MRRWQVVLVVAGMLAAMPAGSSAQRPGDDTAQWFFGFPGWTVELHAGLANYGRFLLQALDSPDGVVLQRALEADDAFALGGSVGAMIMPRTVVRIAFTHAFSSDLDYRDDTGLDLAILDIDGVAGLSSSILSLEVARLTLSDRHRLSPFGSFGVGVVWWNLDQRLPLRIVAGNDDETQTRAGVLGSIGLQYRAMRNIAVRAEVATWGLGNPFTGRTSFVPTTGFTIDEPTRVRQTQVRLGLAYTFGRPDAPGTRRD